MSTTKTKHKASLPISEFYDTVLQDKVLMSGYLEDALEAYNETGDWPAMQLVLQHITRAQGISATAEQMGLSRQSLSNMLNGDSVPSAARFLKLVAALGFRLQVSLPEAETDAPATE